jgi:drug/metabolite transporter (DMT)-like permease
MNQGSSFNIRVYAALITVQILFGINYVVSKVIVGTFPPLIWASFRILVSAVAMFAIATASGRKRPILNREFILPLFLFSLLGVMINQGSFLIGLKYTTATNSAILNTLIPVFTLLMVTLTGKEPFTLKRVCGFLSALAGVLIIRKVESFTVSDTTLIGDALTILNCFSYAIFLTISKKHLEKYDPMWTTTWMFIFGSVGFTLASIPSWSEFHMPTLTPQLIGGMAFSILGSTLLAYLLNIWALARTHSSSVALFIYLQPVVASLLAWFSFGEMITLRTFLASLLIFSGMLLSMAKKTK